MNVTIPQKMSGTGSIHDIASDDYDRDIAGPGVFAVVLAAYYGGRGYTTHKSETAAIKQAQKLRDYSLQIIDESGRHMHIYGDRLVG